MICPLNSVPGPQNGNKKMAKTALRFGANINAQNYKGNTALHYCFSYHYIPLGEYLISKGAKDTIVNMFGLTCYEGVSPDKVRFPSLVSQCLFACAIVFVIQSVFDCPYLCILFPHFLVGRL
jgi:hypothetical protein